MCGVCVRGGWGAGVYMLQGVELRDIQQSFFPPSQLAPDVLGHSSVAASHLAEGLLELQMHSR